MRILKGYYLFSLAKWIKILTLDFVGHPDFKYCETKNITGKKVTHLLKENVK